jgi:hypothetical protein
LNPHAADFAAEPFLTGSPGEQFFEFSHQVQILFDLDQRDVFFIGDSRKPVVLIPLFIDEKQVRIRSHGIDAQLIGVVTRRGSLGTPFHPLDVGADDGDSLAAGFLNELFDSVDFVIDRDAGSSHSLETRPHNDNE